MYTYSHTYIRTYELGSQGNQHNKRDSIYMHVDILIFIIYTHVSKVSCSKIKIPR